MDYYYYSTEELLKMKETGKHIHSWNGGDLSKGELVDLEEEIKRREEVQAEMKVWKKKNEKKWKTKVAKLDKLIDELKELESPIMENGELSPWGQIDSMVYHLENSYEDEDVWNSSSLC